jgi:hypothetical protein
VHVHSQYIGRMVDQGSRPDWQMRRLFCTISGSLLIRCLWCCRPVRWEHGLYHEGTFYRTCPTLRDHLFCWSFGKRCFGRSRTEGLLGKNIVSVLFYDSKEGLEIQNVFLVAEARRNRSGADNQSEHLKWFAHYFWTRPLFFFPLRECEGDCDFIANVVTVDSAVRTTNVSCS